MFGIIEAGGDFGGTWYWNRYPGCQCDVESYIYLPLLEELGYMPKEKYAYAKEIFEHSQRIGKAYGLYENTCFQTRVTELRWDESIKRWIIRTNRNDEMKARFVINAVGGVSKAKLPGVPGIDTFEGHSFHTTRWDYEYTGGDTTGNLHKLGDKRVAIIGTGATAIQCVPYVGKYAKHTLCFPANSFIGRSAPQQTYRSTWVGDTEAGLAAASCARTSLKSSPGRPVKEDLVDDGWTDIFRNNIASGFVLSSERAQAAPEDARAARGVGGLPEDEHHSCAGGRGRREQGSRRGAQALVSGILQAADFQRRIPSHLQSPQRDAG